MLPLLPLRFPGRIAPVLHGGPSFSSPYVPVVSASGVLGCSFWVACVGFPLFLFVCLFPSSPPSSSSADSFGVGLSCGCWGAVGCRPPCYPLLPLCCVFGLLLAVSLPCSTVCSDRLLGGLTFRHVSCLRTIEFHSVWCFAGVYEGMPDLGDILPPRLAMTRPKSYLHLSVVAGRNPP